MVRFCSVIGKLVKDVTSAPKLSYKFNAIPIKILVGIFYRYTQAWSNNYIERKKN